ncbi:GNAT family N-acetyltransferase [Legionella fallonii]|uniref:Acetyltransferase n=1 Tax=Legionella fallonii LLAP-10 TaxID=1212491 RepID=A0A098G5X3_9GAMM|nr:GNAT family N-acetyltransferase [Legionella fallonii]CEG56900.1 Acetyltransferase [Legionella fallonii LLAP-10]
MTNSSTTFSLRAVKTVDLDSLFSMLVELVKYEGIYERFKLTRDRLEEELFGTNADWNCLVAVDMDEHLIGFCLYTFANINRAFNISPMIQIDDLYVHPQYRRAGLGQLLLKEMGSIARVNNIGRLNAWCVKDNDIGQNFYQKIGAVKRDFIDIYSIDVNELT